MILSPGMLRHLDKVKFLVQNNQTTILTGMGVTGTIATAYLTGRASFKAADIIAKEETKLAADPDHDLTTKEKVKLVWPQYIVPAGAGIITISSIIVANKISSNKIAALTIASGISERALQEYKAKVVEKIGERQERNIRDELAQDHVTKTYPKSGQVVVVGTGKVLCYDEHTGRYFDSTVETIKKGINKINHDIIHFMAVSLSEFYEELGLPPTTYTDSVGWNTDRMVDVEFSTTMSPDGQPCIAINFTRPPVPDYMNPHKY